MIDINHVQGKKKPKSKFHLAVKMYNYNGSVGSDILDLSRVPLNRCIKHHVRCVCAS